MPVDLAPSTRGYWDAAAETYDRDFTDTLIGQMRREAVWRDLDRVLLPGQRVLELNCGTGIDALHLAERGVRTVACDIAPRMIDLARERVSKTQFGEAIDFRVLATEEIGKLEDQFDGAFSNFAGLNCVEDLSSTAQNLWRVLKPGAPVLLCMLGRFVPWEIFWFLAHGDPGRAIQRLRGRTVRSVEGGALKVQYPPVKEIARVFAPGFRLEQWKGIGIGVPPSYMERWARRFPGIIKALVGMDSRIGSIPILRGMADCVLLHFSTNPLSAGRPR